MTDLPITLVDYANPEDYRKAKTEFIIFVNKTNLATTVEKELYQVYKNNPQFRKLSMVAPVIRAGSTLVYGWELSNGYIVPRHTPSSREPYAIQIGSVVNSIIRKSALDRLQFVFSGDEYADSADLSLALWESGNRCYIDPNTEMPGYAYLDFNLARNIEPYGGLQKLFKREMIG